MSDHMPEGGLGRLAEPDERDHRFLMRAAQPSEADAPMVGAYIYRRGANYNQKKTGTCVAHAWRAWMDGEPLRTKKGPTPFELYDRCILADGFPDNDNDTERQMGTSVRAGAKVLSDLGHVKSYLWAFTVDDVRRWMLTGQGGLVFGLDWYSGLGRPDEQGVIRATGMYQGGHAIYGFGADDRMGVVLIQNSWGCHDDQTDILTEHGWRRFSALTGYERVATLNPATHALEYQHPQQIHAYAYDGTLWAYRGEDVDLLVTPNHRLYYRTKGAPKDPSSWALTEARLLDKRHVHMKGDAGWQGRDVAHHRVGDIDVPMDDWLAFLGFWLSEGHATHQRFMRPARVRVRSYARSDGDVTMYETNEAPRWQDSHVVGISQRKGENVATIQRCLDRLPFSFIRHRDTWTTNRTALYDEVVACGEQQHERRIPPYVYALSVRQQRILYDALMLGDGSYKDGKGGNAAYYTSSPGLADDFQRLLLHIGLVGNVRTVDRRGRDNGSGGITRHVEYQIGIKQIRTEPRPSGGFRPEAVAYRGMVYCVTVPNGITYTRRNGKAVWSGNSEWGGWAHPVFKTKKVYRGCARLPYEDLDKLLRQQGEACTAVQQVVRPKEAPTT